MKIRESGMPKEEQWTRFFDPPKILRKLGLGEDIVDVVDFGCGYGTFTVSAAKMIRGKIYAFDIEPEMIRTLELKAKALNLTNVKAILRDFVSEGSGLKDFSVDYVMLFNILHMENPVKLLKEAYRILNLGGKVGVIHWNYDVSTPAGPPMDIRTKPEQIKQWGEFAKFSFEGQFNLKPYHYGIVFRK